MRQVVNRADAECQASAEPAPSPQTPHPRTTDARSRGIKFPISHEELRTEEDDGDWRAYDRNQLHVNPSPPGHRRTFTRNQISYQFTPARTFLPSCMRYTCWNRTFHGPTSFAVSSGPERRRTVYNPCRLSLMSTFILRRLAMGRVTRMDVVLTASSDDGRQGSESSAAGSAVKLLTAAALSPDSPPTVSAFGFNCKSVDVILSS